MGFAMHSAEHERIIRDIAEAFAKRGEDQSSGWSK